ncbi:MAG: putative transporter [Anaerocolumna sp.]|nr:putative transporter [Anaerocolumna sp.]
MGVIMIRDNNTVLNITGLNKKIGNFTIKDINFSLDTGYIMGFIGRNGAGKTTVMKLIQNVLVKDSGKITIGGFDNKKQEIQAKNEIGFVMEHAPFIKNFTLMENGELFGKYYTRFNKEQYISLLGRFQLNANKNLFALSKGMETKFQLAFALAHSPKLLILDEPTDGLDPIFRKDFLKLLQELIEEEKMAILLSTHITSDGNKELLTKIPLNKFVAVRNLGTTFEGMTECYNDIEAYCGNDYKLISQRADLEDIMYYVSKGRRQIDDTPIYI